MPKHKILKLRKDVVRRTLTVRAKQFLTPRMLRITFQSDDLLGFESSSPDDHIKIFLPAQGGEIPSLPDTMRDFTPRAWDIEAGTFTLEFALHQSGPATEWALAARPGDTLQIGGPRGSTVVPDDFDWYLLIGDATALPSFARRLEKFRAGVPVQAFITVADTGEQQALPTNATAEIRWLTAGVSLQEDVSTLRTILDQSDLPAGDGFIWIAAEASVSREIYSYLVDERAHPREWIKASAYWTRAPDGDEPA